MPRQQRQRQPVLQDFKEFRQLVEVQGPFVSTAVLRTAFPQGFPSEDSLPSDLNSLRLQYDAWLAAPAFDLTVHEKWVRSVISSGLEFEAANVLSGQDIPQSVRFAISPSLLIGSAPDEDLITGETAPGQPLFPVFVQSKGEKLDAVLDSAVAYLRQTVFPIAVVTNGEQWAIVHAPSEGVTSVATWYAEMWWEERLTFRAFRALLGARRWFNVAATETLPALLKSSEDNQGAITKQLGRQVRQAVELLILSLDRADQDKNRGLLADVTVQTLYEAALSVMMRSSSCSSPKNVSCCRPTTAFMPKHTRSLRFVNSCRRKPIASELKYWSAVTMPGVGCSPPFGRSTPDWVTIASLCLPMEANSSIPIGFRF